MARNIDSIGPKPSDSVSDSVQPGDVVKSQGAPPTAGEVVRPEGYAPPAETPEAPVRTIFSDKVVNKQQKVAKKLAKKQARRDRFRQLNKSFKYFYVLLAIVGIFGIGFIVWIKWGEDFVRSRSNDPNVKPVAKVGSTYITQAQLKDRAKSIQEINSKTSNSNVENFDELAYNELTLEAALKNEASKRGVKVGDGDIDETIRQAGFDPKVIRGYAKSIGESEENALRTYRINTYKRLLAQYLIDSRDVRTYLIRWDIAPDPIGTDIINKGAAFDNYQVSVRKKLEDKIYNPIKSGKSFKDIEGNIDIDVSKSQAINSPASKIITRQIKDLNRQANSEFQDGEKDWAGIERLNKVGDFTDIIRSDGGYYSIYVLEAINKGDYNSWNDYQDAVKRNAKRFSQENYLTRYVYKSVNRNTCESKMTDFDSRLRKLLGINTAEACDSNHWNIINGFVVDQFGNGVAGASILVGADPGYTATVDYCGGNTSGTTVSNGAPLTGYWSVGDGFSCFNGWNAAAAKSGCFPSGPIHVPNPGTNNGTISVTLPLWCGPGDTPPTGNLDAANCTQIVGWARDPDWLSGRIKVHIYIDDAYYTELTADGARADSVNGYGFSMNTPSAYINGVNHSVKSYAIGVDNAGTQNGNNPQVGSAITFNCPAPSYTVGGFKVSRPWNTPDEPGVKDAPVDMDGNIQTTNPYGLGGFALNANHVISVPNDVGDFIFDFYYYNKSSCNNNAKPGNPGCTSNTITINKNDTDYADIWWHYKPKPSSILAQGLYSDGTTQSVPPCSPPAVDFRGDICGRTIGLTWDMAIAGTPEAGYAGATPSTTLAGVNNEGTLGNLYPGYYRINGAAPAGWVIEGYRYCNNDDSACLSGAFLPDNRIEVPINNNRKVLHIYYKPLFSAACVDFDNSLINAGLTRVGSDFYADAGQLYNINVSLQNTGVRWGNWSPGFGKHNLGPTIDNVWGVSASGFDVSGSVANSNIATFAVSATAPGLTTSAKAKLSLRMRWILDGGTTTAFGDTCEKEIILRGSYSPWARFQNGGVAALGEIIGQSSLSRGGRKAIGQNQDINAEAQFVITAAVTTNNFCSSNVYLLGRGTGSACGGASGVQYVFNIPDQAMPRADDYTADPIIRSVNNIKANFSTCTNTLIKKPLKLSDRYYAGADITSSAASGPGSLNAALVALKGDPDHSLCPTIYKYTAGTTLGAPISNPGGRVTILVEPPVGTPFTINSNIVNAFSSTINYNPGEAGSDGSPYQMNALPNLGIMVMGDVVIDNDVSQIDASIYASGKIITCDQYLGGITTGPKLTSDAIQCAKKLKVRGGLFAKGGFQFGRNWYDSLGIGKRIYSSTATALYYDRADFDNKGIGQNPPPLYVTPQYGYYGGPAEDVIGNGLNTILPPPGFENIAESAFTNSIITNDDLAPKF